MYQLSTRRGVISLKLYGLSNDNLPRAKASNFPPETPIFNLHRNLITIRRSPSRYEKSTHAQFPRKRFEYINQRRNNYTLSWQVGIRNCHLHRSRGKRGGLEGKIGCVRFVRARATVDLIKGLLRGAAQSGLVRFIMPSICNS